MGPLLVKAKAFTLNKSCTNTKGTLIRVLEYLLKNDLLSPTYRVNWFHLHQLSESNGHASESIPKVYVRTHIECEFVMAVFRAKKPFLLLNGRYLIAGNNKDEIQLLDATPAESTFFTIFLKDCF